MMDRRSFIQAMAGALFLPSTFAMANTSKREVDQSDFWTKPRSLYLQRGGRKMVLPPYYKDGEYDQTGYQYCCWMLRDIRGKKTYQMDLALLNVLFWMQGAYRLYGVDSPIIITSGYRSPATNNATEGAAKHSMHMTGQAVDMRIKNVPTKHIASLTAYIKQGGVGWYPQDGFVHIDTGKKRFWRG